MYEIFDSTEHLVKVKQYTICILITYYNMYILQSWTGLVIQLQKECIYDIKDISKFKDIKDNSYFNYRRF
jgi:hypothetical protein